MLDDGVCVCVRRVCVCVCMCWILSVTVCLVWNQDNIVDVTKWQLLLVVQLGHLLLPVQDVLLMLALPRQIKH